MQESAASGSEPREVYQSRRDRIRASGLRTQRRHILLGNLRLGIVVAAMAVLVASLPKWWLVAPVVLFLLLSVLHEGVIRRLTRLRRAFHVYELALGRLNDKWAGRGRTGQRFLDSEHPYAEDLDLFGKGSLFERLCIARTRAGEETLAHWLCQPADPDTVRSRQIAVEELRPMLDLRERIAVLGADVRTGVHAQELAAWGRSAPAPPNGVLRLTALALALFQITAVALWIADISLIPGVSVKLGCWVPVLVVAGVQTLFWLKVRKRVMRVVHSVELPGHDLRLLTEVLATLEVQQFEADLLKKLLRSLESEGCRPSQQIARLSRWVDILDDREHLLLRLVGPPLLWTTQSALAIENWHRHCGPVVARWLEAVGEFEALSSLAAYAYERPTDPFPEFVADGPLFDATGITHPLLPEEKAVRNDVKLGDGSCLMIVSGSNMSGKTTLLRTVGVNAVLAMAGAPVRAQRLLLSPLNIGASIRVHDSLQDGKSRFYWEIERLKKIFDAAGNHRSLLFLLDELLHGTNSHDRKIGAESLLRGLLKRRAVGLTTTHDLALASIADALDVCAANVHFEDHFENGQITFDYRMRPGVVEKSNALELMRSIGLEV